MILALKLLLTPLFIGVVTLAGRRWGPRASGLLIGLPLTSGPISVFLALQYGRDFAAASATGNMAGQVSVCVFCLVYFFASKRLGALASASLALAAFLAATLAASLFSLKLPMAFILLCAVILAFLRIMPRESEPAQASQAPVWDLPARMLVATAFVLGLTSLAKSLGPQLSGLLAPLPIFALVIATFTLRQQGREAAGIILRGIVRGSWSYGLFFLVVGSLLPRLAPHWTYPLATVAALGASGVGLLAARPRG